MSTSNHPFLDHQFLQTKPPSLTMAETLRWKPAAVEVAPNCPRCFSSNTKFCYYNNYSVSQPRYFCKSCRRYWTKGGSLRNVPIGGGCRKSRRSRSRDCQPGAAEPISGSESGGDADAAASVKERDLEGGVIDGGDCLYEDFDGFGLGSEMVWSEQPLMQEFEVFTNDDDHQLRMSDENWGLFDLSAYENFN